MSLTKYLCWSPKDPLETHEFSEMREMMHACVPDDKASSNKSQKHKKALFDSTIVFKFDKAS